jgi:hypothetical protein
MGARPVLPDYLPAIARVADAPNPCYSFGHQHIGLTLAAVTATAVADLFVGHAPRHDISGFDLRRFDWRPRSTGPPNANGTASDVGSHRLGARADGAVPDGALP